MPVALAGPAAARRQRWPRPQLSSSVQPRSTSLSPASTPSSHRFALSSNRRASPAMLLRHVPPMNASPLSSTPPCSSHSMSPVVLPVPGTAPSHSSVIVCWRHWT